MQTDGWDSGKCPEGLLVPNDNVGWEGATEDLGAGRLFPGSLPPLPAEEADLVGHHALLELVLRCHRTAHLTGAAFKGGDFHHVVDKGQREAEAAQDVSVLLLLKGHQGGGYRGKAAVPGRAAHLQLCQRLIPANRNNSWAPNPLQCCFGQGQPNSASSLHIAPVPPPQ